MSDFFGSLGDLAIAGIPIERFGAACLIVLASVLLRQVISGLLLHRLAHVTRRTETVVDDILLEAARQPLAAAIVLAGLGIALGLLGLPSEPVNLRGFAAIAFRVAVSVVTIWFLFRLVDGAAEYYIRRAEATASRVDDALIPLFRKGLKVFLGITGVLVILQNMGYSISGLIAGLGIGGLAVALAAKDTLANVFGSVTILVDRPFQVGDWVKTNEFEGVVEQIGFRSTRVRTFPRTQVVVPNGMLVNMTVDNYQAMPVRRIQIQLGVTYATRPDQMRALLAELERLIDSLEGVAPEGRLVRFENFGASSLDLVVRCFTYDITMDEHSLIRQQLLLGIMERVEALGIEIAFPSQTLYFGKGEKLLVDQSPQR